ncbi:threonine aldolase family protein [Marinicella gelatinilytica]|uniref:threonine aldolase family protein n=1 Tax=Marinicella gelatinilytica TaxID=2996017 RepID=UPI002260C74E|nr:low specificity L-threonine aldolase [Marinicella gelatinilytica]MCX7545446.1 low specificity L-threonine aldolase [Marinicella gelatinilytica]
MKNFRSDNEAPVHPDILQAMVDANQGFSESYGYDVYSEQLTEQFQQLFGCWCEVLPLTTGTAANSIATALTTPPYGAIYCHPNSHINVDECGAPEFFSGGAKLITVTGDNGKIDIDRLNDRLENSGHHGEHESLPAAISLTQCTESGTVYSLAELKAIKKLADKYGLAVHMDGARFANALVTLGVNAAEATWQSGIDLLSFGATKNGAMMAEALVIFNPVYNKQIKRLRKRAGHLISKMRYVNCQLLAYLKNDLWLQLAHHANQQAQLFVKSVNQEVTLLYPVEANEVFCRLPLKQINSLEQQDFLFHRWPGQEGVIRLVFSFATKTEDTEQLIRAINNI